MLPRSRPQTCWPFTRRWRGLSSLTDDIARRQADHRSGRKTSPQEVAQQGLAYLKRAEPAASVTRAFYQIRARLLTAAGRQAEALKDEDLARRTSTAIALDHYLLACAAYDVQDMAEAIKQYEAALRVEPGHYWSLLLLGICLSSRDRPEQDLASAAGVLTGCILRRADHSLPWSRRGYVYHRLKRFADAKADLRQAVRLRPRRWGGARRRRAGPAAAADARLAAG